MSKYSRIFIVGQPGAGKGIIAKILAKKLGWKFIDIDLGLELRMEKILPDIIGDGCMVKFFKSQTELLESIVPINNVVVATDSTIVCSEDCRQFLSNQFVVYLQASVNTLMERLEYSSFPLLNKANIQHLLNQLHIERDALFEQAANISIDTDDNDVESHLAKIIKAATLTVIDELSQLKLNDLAQEQLVFHKQTYTPVKLSKQQTICLKLLSEGLTSKEIAKSLDISFRTVEGYIAKMISLLGCSSTKDLISLFNNKI